MSTNAENHERPTFTITAEQNADTICPGTQVPLGTVLQDLPHGNYVTDTSLVIDSEGRLSEGRLVRVA